ncbi:MAG: hypothetical protein COB37_04895 [Kordiimonadales bacterium]|nr:MAG: hypothetical protein COB37_04895 [Kordiimonadales bacterium]
MALNKVTAAVSLPVFLLVTACSSYGGDWPNLGAPLPKAEERNRTVTAPVPIAPITYADTAPTDPTEIDALLADIKQALRVTVSEYQAVSVKFAAASITEKPYVWNEMQFALTRVSQTASRLDPFLSSAPLASTPLLVKIKALKEEQDAFLVAERGILAGSKP